MQVTLILENKLQKQIFYQNMTISSPTDMYILNTCQDGNVYIHATTYKLKRRNFTLNS